MASAGILTFTLRVSGNKAQSSDACYLGGCVDLSRNYGALVSHGIKVTLLSTLVVVPVGCKVALYGPVAELQQFCLAVMVKVASFFRASLPVLVVPSH